MVMLITISKQAKNILICNDRVPLPAAAEEEVEEEEFKSSENIHFLHFIIFSKVVYKKCK